MHDDPVITAMVNHAKERAELRSHTRDRTLVDPVALMVAKLLRRLCQVPAEVQPEAVLDATAAIMAAYDDAVAAGRTQAAADIRAHADKWAPADGNFAQLRVRRHLGIAERVAAGPLTAEEVAQALNEFFAPKIAGGEPRG